MENTTTPTTTDTPRTDAALVDHMPECSEWSQHYLDLSTFARQIERELNEAKALCSAQYQAIQRLEQEEKPEYWKEKGLSYCERAEKAEAEVERLKKELADWDYGTRAKREQERAEKAEAELERIYAGMQGSCYCCEPVGEMNQKLEADVERLRGIANRAISTLVIVVYGEETIDFEWPDIMRKVGELRNEFPFLGLTTEDSSAPQL